MKAHQPAGPADAVLDEALADALQRLLIPLARLCLARSVTFGVLEEMLKRAYVSVARDAHQSTPGARDISRVSAATGLNRREVTRITQDVKPPAAVRPSPATQIFTRWLGAKKLHDRQGNPRPLKRQGKAPSFDALAQSVTRDIHPRSMLEELCRLGLVRVDDATDTVHLVHDFFVPGKDQRRLFGFLGTNVGDHLSAAVDNVLADAPPHFEQAIFADELSSMSAAKVQNLVAAEWKKLLTEFVPRLEALIAADQKAARPQDQRVRIGLFSYRDAMDRPDEDSKDL